MRLTARRTALVLAVLPVALAECLVQERNGGDVAEVHNASREPIWIAADAAASDVLLQLDPDEVDVTCLVDAGDVDVYDTDPTGEPQPTPMFSLPFGDDDFCDGLYRWDGATLERVE